MARALWTGSLTFGLVSVPVGLYSATSDQTVHFHQLHKGTSHRIRYKKIDEATGEEVPQADIVNGFEVEPGEYIIVNREDLSSAASGRSEVIEISDFVDLSKIDPIYFRQSYYLAPRGKGADRAYGLLRQAMREVGKVGIARLVLRDKEHLVAVRPGEDALLLETMYFADEIREPSDASDGLPARGEFSGRELDVAKQLVESLSTSWKPDQYRNTYRERVEQVLEQRREGHVVHAEAPARESNVVDLLAALEASVARSGTSGGARKRGSEPGKVTARASSAATQTKAAREKSAPPRPVQQELEGMSKAELLARAAELAVQGRSKMSKLQLVKAVSEAEPTEGQAREVS